MLQNCLITIAPGNSLRSKHSHMRRTKFGPRERIFRIRAARKMGREQKGGKMGMRKGKEGNACPQTPRFKKKNAQWFSRLNSFID